MITIVKLDPQGEAIIRFQGEVVERTTHAIIIQAIWTSPARDLGYTCFEPGDRFTEYYYTDRWFNILDIASADGVRKGWYCNIAEPARIFDSRVEQIDLLLDVWVNPVGELLILDEDEFAADTKLSDEQRTAAQQALQALLHVIEKRQDVFASLADNQL
jgi:protein associated with RNAse G/E